MLSTNERMKSLYTALSMCFEISVVNCRYFFSVDRHAFAVSVKSASLPVPEASRIFLPYSNDVVELYGLNVSSSEQR